MRSFFTAWHAVSVVIQCWLDAVRTDRAYHVHRHVELFRREHLGRPVIDHTEYETAAAGVGKCRKLVGEIAAMGN